MARPISLCRTCGSDQGMLYGSRPLQTGRSCDNTIGGKNSTGAVGTRAMTTCATVKYRKYESGNVSRHNTAKRPLLKKCKNDLVVERSGLSDRLLYEKFCDVLHNVYCSNKYRFSYFWIDPISPWPVFVRSLNDFFGIKKLYYLIRDVFFNV